MKIAIYVISLVDSPRREIIKKRACSVGVKIEFVDAVEGRKITQEVKNSWYDREKCIERHGRELSDNEIACFLSHIKAWEKVAQNSYPSVILEDDAILSNNFFEALVAINSMPIESDIILLGHSKLAGEREWYHYFKNPIYNKKKSRGFFVGHVYKLWTSGMVGYWLKPISAQKLISHNALICCVSDDWAYHQENGLVIEEFRPYIVREDFRELASSLETGRSKLSSYRRRRYLEPFRIVIAIFRHLRSFMS